MKEYLAEVIHKFVPLNGSGIPVGNNIDEVCDTLLANPSVICFTEPGKGIILGMVYPCYWNPSVLIAQEFGWWVEPEYRSSTIGIRLYKQFKTKAKELGATKISMFCLETSEPDRLEQFYLKEGYVPSERSFMGDL